MPLVKQLFGRRKVFDMAIWNVTYCARKEIQVLPFGKACELAAVADADPISFHAITYLLVLETVGVFALLLLRIQEINISQMIFAGVQVSVNHFLLQFVVKGNVPSGQNVLDIQTQLVKVTCQKSKAMTFQRVGFGTHEHYVTIGLHQVIKSLNTNFETVALCDTPEIHLPILIQAVGLSCSEFFSEEQILNAVGVKECTELSQIKLWRISAHGHAPYIYEAINPVLP